MFQRIRFTNFLALALCFMHIYSCDIEGDEGEDGKDPGYNNQRDGNSGEADGSATIVLKATNLKSISLTDSDDEDEERQECEAAIGTSRKQGVCITPIDVEGRAHYINATDASLSASFDDQARIVKAGKANATEEAGQIILGENFSLTDSTTINGANELFSAYKRKPTYNQIAFDTYFLKFKFAAKDQYVTALIVTHDQPFVDADVANDGECALSSDEKTQSRYENSEIFSDMTFKRGDYLFCVKDTSDATCSADDYKWFDKDSETLVETRPSNPRVHQFLIFDKPSCAAEGDRKNFSIPGLKFIATLDESFQLYADYSHGVDSQQWPEQVTAFGEPASDPSHVGEDGFEEPYLIYYYKPDGGTTTEGSTLEVTLDFDVENMLFVELDEDEYDSASLEEILEIIDTKTNIGFHEIGEKEQEGYNPLELTGLEVSATVTVSGGTERPDE